MKAILVCAVLVAGCSGAGSPGFDGNDGPSGKDGADGAQGPAGPAGADAAASGERIKARWQTSEDGYRAHVGSFDSDLGVPCGFATAADGTSRCMPFGAASVQYTDPQCTQAVGVSACDEPALYASAIDVSACSVVTYFVRNVGQPIAAPAAVYANGGGTCYATVVLAGYTYFEVGPVLPPDTFAEGAVETDP